MTTERKNTSGPPRGERSPVTPFELKGRLVRAGGKPSGVMLVWNVSDEGLCLWVTTRFAQGELVSLEILHPWVASLTGEVRWCRTIQGRSGFLVGLAMTGEARDLAEIRRVILEACKDAS